MACLILKPDREKSLLRQHPWLFAGAIERFEGRARPGDTVDILACDGRWLARGAYSPESQIRVRRSTMPSSSGASPPASPVARPCRNWWASKDCV